VRRLPRGVAPAAARTGLCRQRLPMTRRFAHVAALRRFEGTVAVCWESSTRIEATAEIRRSKVPKQRGGEKDAVGTPWRGMSSPVAGLASVFLTSWGTPPPP
jgi:hypothetical protein